MTSRNKREGCSPKQAALIEKLMGKGAPIPANENSGNPDMSMFDSVKAADEFIKKNGHYMKKHTGVYAFEADGDPKG